MRVIDVQGPATEPGEQFWEAWSTFRLLESVTHSQAEPLININSLNILIAGCSLSYIGGNWGSDASSGLFMTIH